MTQFLLKHPAKSAVLVFDQEGSEILARTVLEGIDHAVLPTRKETIYLNPFILLKALMNIRLIRIALNEKPYTLSGLKKIVGQIKAGLYNIYLLACVEYIRPKLVITFIDNRYSFQFISRNYKAGLFYAIQNGIRLKINLRDVLPPRPEPGSVISMPNLFSFGAYEEELYRQFGHEIDNIYPVGSLRADHYKQEQKNKSELKRYDLCLISQWQEEIDKEATFGALKTGLSRLDEFLSRYLKERGYSCCIALRSGEEWEREHFRELYRDRVDVIRSDIERMSSYRAVDSAKVSVSFLSTLGVEAFGWGAKVLFCNYSGDPRYDLPWPGFWSTKEPDYAEFKVRLDGLIGMGAGEYAEKTKQAANYLMNHDDARPAQERIREIALKVLQDK